MQNINKSNIHNAFDYLYSMAIKYSLFSTYDEIFVCPEKVTEDMCKYFEELGAAYISGDDDEHFIFYT